MMGILGPVLPFWTQPYPDVGCPTSGWSSGVCHQVPCANAQRCNLADQVRAQFTVKSINRNRHITSNCGYLRLNPHRGRVTTARSGLSVWWLLHPLAPTTTSCSAHQLRWGCSHGTSDPVLPALRLSLRGRRQPSVATNVDSRPGEEAQQSPSNLNDPWTRWVGNTWESEGISLISSHDFMRFPWNQPWCLWRIWGVPD